MRKFIKIIINIAIGFVVVILFAIILMGGTFYVLNTNGKINGIAQKFMNDHLSGEMRFDSLHFNFSEFPVIEVTAVNGVLLSDTMAYPSDTMAAFSKLKAKMNPLKVFTENLIDIPYVYLDKPQAVVTLNEKGRPGWAIWHFKKKKNASQTSHKRPKTKLNISYVEIYGHPRFFYHNLHTGMCIKADSRDLFFQGRIAIDYKKIDANYFHIHDLNYKMTVPKASILIDTHSDSILIQKKVQQSMGNYRFHVVTVLDTIYVKSNPVMLDNNFEVHGDVGIGFDYQALDLRDLRLQLDTTIMWMRGNFRKVPHLKGMYTDLAIRLSSPSLNKTIQDIVPLRNNFPKDFHLYLPLLLTVNLEGIFSPSKRIYPDIYTNLKIGPGKLDYKSYPEFDHIQADLDLYYIPSSKNSGLHIHSLKMNALQSSFSLNGDVKNAFLNPYARINLFADLDLSGLSALKELIPPVSGRLKAKINVESPVLPLLKRNTNAASLNAFVNLDSIQGNFKSEHFFIQNGTLKINVPVLSEKEQKDSIRLHLDFDSIGFGTIENVAASLQNLEMNLFTPRRVNLVPEKFNGNLLMNEVDLRFHQQNTFKVANIRTDYTSLFRRDQSILDSLVMKTAIRGIYGKIDSTELMANHIGLLIRTEALKKESQENKNTYHKSPDTAEKLSFIKSLGNYNFSGGLILDQAYALTPVLPLPNEVERIEALFTRHLLSIPVMRFISGESALSLSAEVENWYDYLKNDSILVSEIALKSDSLNLSQLIPAVTKGILYMNHIKGKQQKELSERLTPPRLIPPEDSLKRTKEKMIEIPDRLNVRIAVDATNVEYDSIVFDESHGKILLTERSLFMHNVFIDSNVGNLDVGVSYQPSETNFARTSLALDLKRLDVKKLLQMVPDLSKLVPMLSTLEGYVGCSVSAQAELDSTLYVIKPTLSGNAQIRGHDLSIEKSKILPCFAGWLLFGKQKKIMLDSIRVNLTMDKDLISIYPFIVDLGRYRVLASGIQDMDDSFFYHLSLQKWLLPFKLGINLYKENKKLHFRLTCPKLKNLDLPARVLSVDSRRLFPSHNVSDSIKKGLKQQQSVFLKYSDYYNSVLKQESEEISKKQTESMLLQLDQLLKK